jgi:hypothetical protein
MNKKIAKLFLTGGSPLAASSRGWLSEIAVPKSQDWWKHIPNLLELRGARSAEKTIVGKRLDFVRLQPTETGRLGSSLCARKLTVLAAFGRRLERWKLRVEDLNEDVVDRFLRKHYPKRRLPRHVRPTLHRLLSMLRESGATPFGLAASLPNPAQQLTNKYRHFPTEERGILSSTACRWCPTFSIRTV